MLDSARVDNLGARVDLAIRRGATWALPLTVGANLTGATILCTVCGVAATVTYVDRPTGRVTLGLTDAQTRALAGPSSLLSETLEGEWGVTLVDSLGARTALLYGPVLVSGEANP